ncbi:MerR family transcriptional regulator [Geobacillus thermocatenulatus]|uniref:MerR family transcriptional regulator n=1 Tax=Geobacillus thermocatenulatus TaxID=33938 RepID=A0A226Q3I9_9BACL|nr:MULTISPECIES: MerR family transcriptional regulator [Geobacillus]AST00561.1 MerR family transcriptional regulator [Geobacillus thermocatenulatus]KLR75216.1 MerR family transcriptional regulator [Geobacillus sp. T6]OXB86943.1 MerR family transcriptional regulator [Geobacillus thermocatenulatus]RAN30300.1 MerR family transcriptional regulator [Geobacillus sp. A8]
MNKGVREVEYTVHELARLAGVTSRTLRYYDEIGLLKPGRLSESGYRLYGPREVDRLQQILFYRELGVDLETIKQIVHSPSFDELKALRQHREQLLEKRRHLDALIANVEKTIGAKERGIMMSDKEKFAAFKERLMEENEQKYGEEIRQKYGEEQVNRSNEKLRNMTKEQFDEAEKLSKDVLEALKEAMLSGDPGGEAAQRAADLHRQWLSFWWDHDSKEAHAGLARLYVEDERFKAYYDRVHPGAAEFLKEAILIYTGMKDR